MRFLAKRIDEFERSILKEIDYTQEAMNIMRFDYNFKEDETVYVPGVYKEYSTKKVITMELIEGRKILNIFDIEGGYDKPYC